MISARLFDVVQCPDCGHTLARDTPVQVTCAGCGRAFAADRGYLDLQPASAFQERTKYLDHALHADARHESIAPAVLGSKIRNDMLQRFLQPAPGDRIVHLGRGSGRAIVLNAGPGARPRATRWRPRTNGRGAASASSRERALPRRF